MHPVWCTGNTVPQWLTDRFVGWPAGCGLDFGYDCANSRLKLVALRLSCDLPLQGCLNCRIVSLLNKAFRCCSLKIQIQHYTVDYLAQGSMKNGANSEMPCKLQDTWTSTLWTQIAEISSSCFHTWLRVGLTSIKQLADLHWAVTVLLLITVWLQDLLTECTVSQLLGFPILGCVCLLQLCRLNLPVVEVSTTTIIIYDLSLGKITGRI